jgi:hypothetical protein
VSELVADHYLETEGTYHFVCSRCWTPQTITLAPSTLPPACRCGLPVSVIAQFTGPANRFGTAADFPRSP